MRQPQSNGHILRQTSRGPLRDRPVAADWIGRERHFPTHGRVAAAATGPRKIAQRGEWRDPTPPRDHETFAMVNEASSARNGQTETMAATSSTKNVQL